MTLISKRTLTALSLGVALSFGLAAQSFAQDATTATEPAAGAATQSGGTAAGATSSTDGASPIEGEAPRNQVGDKFELPRYSEDNQVELITGLCGIQMKNMSEAACGCVAERSLTALSDPQRDYLIAAVVAPPVADRMLGDGRVGEPDQKTIFAFLEKESATCRAENASAEAPAGDPATGNGSDAAPATSGAPASAPETDAAPETGN
ncbi:hypothetical protein U0C82_15630 [Fulvimarina sp. 2208YS6-2-32]|uniref:Uncharacterized protein n=1 Tax=Fulvimarina uroteuthidis TaxID=3098149 RepID=A0ABU5I731_9HYPH|nr:hypothetical protein [Fulvimarina sp. 2208YS6-2-32]MDY8110573.1 hypothetical protein [Fulvimarina sp. 2208YS6-2-32]